MTQKGFVVVEEELDGAEICFKNGFVHKVYNGEEREIYVFASPIHKWYVPEYPRAFLLV